MSTSGFVCLGPITTHMGQIARQDKMLPPPGVAVFLIIRWSKEVTGRPSHAIARHGSRLPARAVVVVTLPSLVLSFFLLF